VTSDTEKFQFNTSIARMMEFVNALYKYDSDFHENIERNGKFFNDSVKDLVILLAPFAPHFAEECWSELGFEYSVFNQEWPKFDAAALVKDEVEIAIQINGKIKARINVPSDLNEDGIKEASLNNEDVKKALEGKAVAKIIVIKGKLVNIVAK
jgi:leucyl-tRNA synthetase